MKKIIGLTIAVVLIIGLVAGGTWAYFTDTEESVGNVFTSGTIDIAISNQNPWTETYTGVLTDVKPCEVRWIVFNIQNVGTNPCDVWKRIVYEDADVTGGSDVYFGICSSEPEFVAGDGLFDANGDPDPATYTETCDIDTVILYDMYFDSGPCTCCAPESAEPAHLEPCYCTDSSGETTECACFEPFDECVYNEYAQTCVCHNSQPEPGEPEWGPTCSCCQWDATAETCLCPDDSECFCPYPFECVPDASGACWCQFPGTEEFVCPCSCCEYDAETDERCECPTTGEPCTCPPGYYCMEDPAFGKCQCLCPVITEDEDQRLDDINTKWIYLGKLWPGQMLVVKQSYHLEGTAGNEYQGDSVTFDIEIFANQVTGEPPEGGWAYLLPPGDGSALVLDGYGPGDWPYCP